MINFNLKKIASLNKKLGDAQAEIDRLTDEVFSLNQVISKKDIELYSREKTIRKYSQRQPKNK